MEQTEVVADYHEPAIAPDPLRRGALRRWWVLPVVVVAAASLLFFGVRTLLSGSNRVDRSLVYFEVKRTDLSIIVTERGNLESQITKEVICEVENFGGDRSGNTGTQILFIVENGSAVEEGDLLVELDSAPLEERMDTQFLTLQRAEADKIQADVQYENRKTQNETDLADAELRVELAKINVQMYEDEMGGTYQIEVQDVEMDILTAQAQQLISESDQKAVQILYGLGYKSKGDLADARLDLLQADSYLASQLAKRRQLTQYTYTKDKLTLKGELETANRALEQVKKDSKSAEAEALSEKISEENSYKKEKERYERYQEQVAKCTIRAPQAGMVAFTMSEGRGRSSTVIEEGAFVRQRQKILTLPDLSKMQVNTAVHESVLDQVEVGLPVTIRIDAFPDLLLHGSVKSVAVLPNQGGMLSSGAKVYKTIVTIDGEVTKLKPGMTAVVQIDVDRLQKVLTVPIQAIVQRGQSNWCYVQADGPPKKQEVTLGKTNDKFVHVEQGLEEGDSVILNPTAILEEQEAREKEAQQALEETQSDTPSSDKKTSGGKGPGGKGPGGKGPGGKGMPGKRAQQGPGKGGAASKAQGAGGRNRAPGKGGFDFGQLDKDGDGKLSKEEVPERMRPMFERVDRDQSGFIERGEMRMPGQGKGPAAKGPAAKGPAR